MNHDSPPAVPGPRPLFDDPTGPGPRAGTIWLAWAAILVVSGLLFWINAAAKSLPTTLPDPALADSTILRFTSRYVLGFHTNLQKALGITSTKAESLESLENSSGSIIDRLRTVPIVAEIAGSDAAFEKLDDLEHEIDSTIRLESERESIEQSTPDHSFVFVSDQAALDALRTDAATLRAIYIIGSGADLTADEQDRLLKRHGWFARVALSHGQSDTAPDRQDISRNATTTFVAMILVALALAGAFLIGIALFVVACAMLGTGKLRSALRPSIDHVAEAPRGVFLETFALFLVAFVLLMLIAGALEAALGLQVMPLVVWALAPIALWPLARGTNWSTLRAALGWHAGRGVIIEALCGVAGHLAGLPIICAGLLITFILVTIFRTDASHPVFTGAGQPGALGIATLCILVVVWAPLVEETFFRGALYAHLRTRWAVLPAALVCGLLFAALHPQGPAGIPVLAALGLNFCLMREWRGSLIAPIAAHALNNGFVTLVLVMVIL